jgi:hypothetical protein
MGGVTRGSAASCIGSSTLSSAAAVHPQPAAERLGFLALAMIGAAAADHAVRLDQLLTPAARRLLARAEAEGIDDLIACGPWWRRMLAHPASSRRCQASARKCS